ncbi:MAG: hypothetical protein K2Y71_28890 [Xanthobacteraceae bacterium]|nr:hypothetical protein [Xanthobacteraceae bacterium]
MSPKTTLILASIAFAVLWTAFMIWQTSNGMANTIILMVSGAIAGVLWYFGMRWAMSMIAAKTARK